jgi:hypothetical protein
MVEINNIKYYSLYEYLGKAAGPDLGTKVNAVAIDKRQPIVKQYVENPVFKGKVMCYTKNFLDSYFNKTEYNPDLDYFHITKDDDLPF